MTIKNRALLWLAPAILGVGVLTACSGSGTAAAPPSSQQPSSQPSSQQQYSDLESWQLAMQKCLSDKGMADQVQDMGGGAKAYLPPVGVDQAALEQAQQDCLSQVGEAPIEQPSADEQAQIQAAKLAFYKCLQDAGYDVATPPANGSGNGSSATGDLSGVPQDVALTCGKESGY